MNIGAEHFRALRQSGNICTLRVGEVVPIKSGTQERRRAMRAAEWSEQGQYGLGSVFRCQLTVVDTGAPAFQVEVLARLLEESLGQTDSKRRLLRLLRQG